MSELAVATTILEQLGGSRFRAMTGAKLFCGSQDSLQFSLPARFAKQGINKVLIKLEPNDTYTVRFYRLRADLVLIEERDGVFADVLRDVFTEVTGLDCTL